MKLRKIKLIIIFLLCSAGLPVFAQQDAMYSQYMFNTLAINPAYAGSRNVLSATGLYRNQWTGIDGAPKTQTFTIDAPLNNKKVGLGIQLFNDKIGVTKTTGVVGSYAYRVRFEKGSLSFGLQSSLSQYTVDFNSVKLDENNSGDDIAFANNVNKQLLNFGTGVYYNSDKFYIGLSAPELLANNISANGSLAKQSVHLFLAAGYVFALANDFKLKPSFLIKEVKGAPIEGDLNATLWIKDMFSVGAQYRTNADISGILEFQATPQIRIGYAYDRSITKLVNYNSGSHEIMLRYEFGFMRNKVISPRYF